MSLRVVQKFAQNHSHIYTNALVTDFFQQQKNNWHGFKPLRALAITMPFEIALHSETLKRWFVFVSWKNNGQRSVGITSS